MLKKYSKTLIGMILALSIARVHGESGLRKHNTSNPFRPSPAVELDSEWNEIGPGSSVSEGETWNRDLFEGVPILLNVVYSEDGTEKPQMALELNIRKTLEERGFRVLAETDLRDAADFELRIDIDVSFLQEKRQKYVRAIATSDLTMEELHGSQRQHHLSGPTQEAVGLTADSAASLVRKRLERDLLLVVRQKVKVRT